MNVTLFSLVLLLNGSDPFDGVWASLDKAQFAEAESAALALAANAKVPLDQQQKALELALTAACQIGKRNCLVGAQRLVDWNPLWRPDSRARPTLIAAAREARLNQAQRLNSLGITPWAPNKGWCSPPGTHQIVKGVDRAGVLGLERVKSLCVPTNEAKGFLIALDAQFVPLAAYGSPATPLPLQIQVEATSRGLIVAGAAALVAGVAVAAYFFRTPPTGSLDVRLMVSP